jgi:hypothetical protein
MISWLSGDARRQPAGGEIKFIGQVQGSRIRAGTITSPVRWLYVSATAITKKLIDTIGRLLVGSIKY